MAIDQSRTRQPRLPRTFRAAAWLLALAVLPAAAAANAFRVPIGEQAALQLDLPAAWHGVVGQSGPSTTVRFTADGADFQLLVTAADSAATRTMDQSPPSLRELVADAAAQSAPMSAEGALPVQDISGPAMHGSWFSATDAAPVLPAGEFRYMTQGIVSADGMLVTFTLLVNADDAAAAADLREQALAALRTLRAAPVAAAAAAADQRPAASSPAAATRTST